MASGANIRSADALMSPAVAETLGKLTLSAVDSAASRLARVYARAIDEAAPDERAKVLTDLGPKLLACLVELGATPRARALTAKGGAPANGRNPLQDLRDAR